MTNVRPKLEVTEMTCVHLIAQYFSFKCSAYLWKDIVIYYDLVTDLCKPNFISDISIGYFLKNEIFHPNLTRELRY